MSTSHCVTRIHRVTSTTRAKSAPTIGSGPPGPGRALRTAVIVLVLAVTIGSTVVMSPAPASAHGWGSNGCTGVPDSGHGFDFHRICDRHDLCYGTRPYGAGYRGRRHCDRVFRARMLTHCERHPRISTRRVVCRSTALAYYYGVRALGAAAWARGSAPPLA